MALCMCTFGAGGEASEGVGRTTPGAQTELGIIYILLQSFPYFGIFLGGGSLLLFYFLGHFLEFRVNISVNFLNLCYCI